MSVGRPRFSIIPAAAVTDPALSGGHDLKVLALLGRHTDNAGWCTRSQVKMARELGCGRGTVQRSIVRLVDAGYLEVRPIVRENGGDAAAEYRVLFDIEDAPVCRKRGGAHQRAGVPTLDGHGVPTHERAPNRTTPLNEREREGASATDDEFEALRRAWPTGFTDSRADASAAWETLTGEERNEAAAEVGRFVAAARAVGRKHIGTLATYLVERRWTALPERPQRSSSTTTTSAPTPADAPPKPVRPTKFQLANPHLYPEMFGDGAATP